jgi:tetratricopeptide (TPR) repeat protein
MNLDTLLRRGVVLPAAFGLIAACSGTPTGETPRESTPPGFEENAPRTNETAPPRPLAQDPQDIGQQRRRTIIDKSLQDARRSLESRLWEDAARIAAEVLEIEPSNTEARDILQTANEVLGRDKPSVTREFQDQVMQGRVRQQKEMFDLRRGMAVGDAHLAAGRFGDAIETYEQALLRLRFSIYVPSGSELERTLNAKLADARDARERAERAAEQAVRAASQAELDKAEREQRLARGAKVARFLEQANFDFQIGKYPQAVALLDQALRLDPTNANALKLRDIAEQARHEFQLDLKRQDWKAEWSRTFDDLKSSDLPQTDPIQFDMERWAEVASRQPLTFTAPEELDSPEERAIIAKLESTRIEHRFADADVENWAAYYQGVTGVNFFVTPAVKELGDAAKLTDFHLPPMSVYKALETIGNLTGTKWKVANGVVQIVTPDKAGGRMYLVPYEVRDIVQGVPDKAGPELKLKAPEEDDAGFGDEGEEAKPTVVDASKLVDLIRVHIAPESWDAGEANITEQRGVLLVRQNKEVHGQVRQLLADLRQSVGIQVDIETRFLKVEDSFLEDIGVDFRGLGNQAAEGVAGRGLERNNRGNAGFDDFGRRDVVNPGSPGEIGTGTEPGVFFDDGQDGDLMARTEHLFDQTLGGQDRLSNAGGLSLQYAFLDDTELEVILRAVFKQERSEEITAPRLLVYNNTRSYMSVLRHTSYIRDFEVEIAQAAAVANPVVDVVRDGVVLDVRPVVSADRKFITMELRPTVMTLVTPIPTFTTTLGVGQPVQIQLPQATLQRLRTTVTMPDGGTLMLGGMKLAEKQFQMSGVPVLKDLPGLSFLFSRKGTFVLNRKILILIRAKIVIPDEHEPVLDATEAELLLGSK